MKRFWVFNCTRQTLVANNVEVAQTFWARMKGLLGRRAGDPRNQGVWLCPCLGIHTVGLSFPIDAAYLDSQSRVVRAYYSLPPFRVAAVSWRTRTVLELPAGALQTSSTRPGDLLQLCSVEQEQETPCATFGS